MNDQLPWIATVVVALAGAIAALAKKRNGMKPHDDKLIGTLSTISIRLNEVSIQIGEVRRDLEPIARHAEAIVLLKAKVDELARVVESMRPPPAATVRPSIWDG